MKTKQLFLLCTLLLIGTVAVIAQQPVAMLEQKGTTKVFYGESSFVEAYNASANGDQIYLSGGTFTPPTSIAKGIKVTGAGHFSSDLLHTQTIINGCLYVNKGADSLRLEGLYVESVKKTIGTDTFDSSVFFDGNSNNYVKFIRCRLFSVLFNTGTNNNCSIEECFVYGSIIFKYSGKNLLVRNSLISGCVYGISSNAQIDGNIFFSTSSTSYHTLDCINYSIIQNNIILGGASSLEKLNSKGNIINNNLFEKTPYYFPGNSTSANYFDIAISNIFVNYLSTLSWDSNSCDFHLKAPKTYVGTDGTPVGIYGGLGFKGKGVPSNPQVISKTISPKTDDKGNLQINITVKAQDN